jgi:HAD superfamily hydrolase (TIGR01549 family)
MCKEDITPWLDEALMRLTETPRREHCPDQIRRIVRRLFNAGYHLAAISNRDGDLSPVLAAHGLDAYFAFTLSGGRAGTYKPNPEIFRIALNTLGVAPAATLVIGDSYHADIVGAQEVGITGVLLDPLGIYPDAPCRTVKRLDDLVPWLIGPHTDGID